MRERRLVVIGVTLFDFRQRCKAFGGFGQRLLKARGVLFRFRDLLVHFLHGPGIAFLLGKMAEITTSFELVEA